MSDGLFFQALQRGEAHEVAMDEVRFIAFTEQSLRCIGTRNLNGCTAVMVVSQYGAILSHIPPRPVTTRHDIPEAGDQHCAEKMNEMVAAYHENRRYFPADEPSWVVSALWEDKIALLSQRHIIEMKLREIGLDTAGANYMAVMPPQSHDSTKGTVFIDARVNGFPRVYVEDILVGGSRPSTSNTSARPTGPETKHYQQPVSQVSGREASLQTSPARFQQYQPGNPGASGETRAQITQTISPQSQAEVLLQQASAGLSRAGNHEEFVQMADNLRTRFAGQSPEFQRQFLEVVRRVRDERQGQRHR
jgi:hypothetical protein